MADKLIAIDTADAKGSQFAPAVNAEIQYLIGQAGGGGGTGGVGPAGPAGPAGADGKDGATGPAGAKGDVGPAGPAGADGAPGADGAVGPAGPVGPQGPAGDGSGGAGTPGPQGEVGPAGPAGADGAPGADGADGAVGPAGPAGAKGDTGPAGPAGADGAPGVTTGFLPTAGGEMTGAIVLPSGVNGLTVKGTTYNMLGGSGGVAYRNGTSNIVNFTGGEIVGYVPITTAGTGVGVRFGSGGPSLSKSGTSIAASAPITVAAAPATDTELANKAYVDSKAGGGVANPVAGSVAGLTLWLGSQAEYDALPTKDAKTIFYIV